jgi:xanthine dehydrogenase/oxidase
LLEQKTGAAGLEEVENILDGNICRCTGYRPIFDAFKTFASGSGHGGLDDIEDTGICKQACSKMRAVGKLANTEGDWYLPSSLADLLLVLGQLPVGSTYRLVNGNTGRGSKLLSYKLLHCLMLSFKVSLMVTQPTMPISPLRLSQSW